MNEGITVRVAAPLANDLITARLAEPIASDRRSGALDLVVQASLVIKDISSIILTIAGGIEGMRTILHWLQGRDLEDVVELTINLPDGAKSWTLRTKELDDVTVREISRVVEALGDDPPAGRVVAETE